jgi:hypothetical protein
MLGLFIAAFQTTLPFADAKASQPVYILGGVISPTAVGAAGERKRPEPLTEPEPARSYAELVGSLTNRECTLLLKHAPTLKLADRFV